MGAVLPPGPGLILLIIAPPETAPTQAKALIQTAGPDRDWILDWVETILVNKFPKLSRAEILMILDLTDTDLRNTRYFQDVFAEGQRDGRHDEAMALVLRQLRRRLGPLPGETQQRIAALTVPQIEALGEALLDFTQPPALTDWLKQHG